MGSKQEKRAAEGRRRYDCPNCDIAMTERWQHDTDWYGGLHYARCAQCLEVFVLTAEGWEEAAGYVRDLSR